MHRLLPTFLILATFALSASAEEQAPPLRLVGEPAVPARLIGVDVNWNVAFQIEDDAGAATRSVETSRVVHWGHPAEIGGGVWLVTVERSLILGLHSPDLGDAVRIADEKLTLPTLLFGDVTLPVRQVRALVFQPPGSHSDRDLLLTRLTEAQGDADRLILTGGDELTGTVSGIENDHVQFESAVGAVSLKLAKERGGDDGRVVAVIFNPNLLRAAEPSKKSAMVGFEGGTLIRASSPAVRPDQAALQLPGGVKLATDQANRLVSLQPLTTSVTYLSDLEPLAYKHQPYLTLAWPYHADRNVLGGRLRADGKLYNKGLGMHSAARLTYRVPAGHKRFAAELALDDAAGGKGSVVYRVFLYKDGSWQSAFASETVRGGDPPADVSVDLADATALTLAIDFAERGDERDYANWLNARLEK